MAGLISHHFGHDTEKIKSDVNGLEFPMQTRYSRRRVKWVEMGISAQIIRAARGNKSLQAYRKYVKLAQLQKSWRYLEV